MKLNSAEIQNKFFEIINDPEKLRLAFNSQESIIDSVGNVRRFSNIDEMNDFLNAANDANFIVTQHEKGRFRNRSRSIGLLDSEISALKNSEIFTYEAIMFAIELETIQLLQADINSIPEDEHPTLMQNLRTENGIIFKECVRNISMINRADETYGPVSDKYILDCLAPIHAQNRMARPVFEDFEMCNKITYRGDGRPDLTQGDNESSDEFWRRIHASNSIFQYLPNENKLIIVHNPIDGNVNDFKGRIDASYDLAPKNRTPC